MSRRQSAASDIRTNGCYFGIGDASALIEAI
jgi:hypothetical protein